MYSFSLYKFLINVIVSKLQAYLWKRIILSLGMEYFIDGGESCPNPRGTPKKITTALKMVSWPQFFFDFDEPGTKWRVIYSSFFLSNYFHNIIYGTVHNFHKCTCMSNLKKLNSAPLPSNAERKITGIAAKEAPMMSYFNPQKYLAQIFFYTRCAKKKKKIRVPRKLM